MSNSPDAPVDLTNCDREPIHLLGRIQSYGALLAVSSDWIVQHASENLGDIMGIGAQAVLGRPLAELVSAQVLAKIRSSLSSGPGDTLAVRLFDVEVRSDRRFDVSIHTSGRFLVVEFEPKADRPPADLLAEVYPRIAAIRQGGTLERLARDAARGLQALCGFQSVMVYQFQPDASGKVIAESRLDGVPRYDGMMFPASDIPVQARALYKRSLLRLISDVDDPGVAIFPQVTIDGAPIDLSLSVTRAVSPIHIEYLRNMGVRASMSVSIMKDGELWGLFACHNDTPLYIDYERRTVVELFAHMFSYELSRFEEARIKQVDAAATHLQSSLMARMAGGGSMAEALPAVFEDIRAVIPHDGIVLFQNGQFQNTGRTPTEERFRAIAAVLDRSVGSDVFSTDCLSRFDPAADDLGDDVAGMLVIPVSRQPRDYLVLFRQQFENTVAWAGDPTKPVIPGPNGVRLTPRKSFEVWKETVAGRSLPWRKEEIHAAERVRTLLLEVFLKVTDAAASERKRNEEHQQLLISELNHRVRNILNLMRGLLAQSKYSARTLEEFVLNLDGRVQSFARAHDLLTAEQWEPVSIASLISCEVDAYVGADANRVTINGQDVLIKPQAFTTIALVLHEMVTNSVKYGALGSPAGRVQVRLERDGTGRLSLEWVERGGPAVTAPTRRGFGSTIIEKSIPHELGGEAAVFYKTTGFEARFVLPASVIDATAPDAQSRTDAAPTPEQVRLSGRALVLEDTLIIAMDAAGILEDLGASEVRIEATVTAALKFLDENTVDFAVLDVNLGQEQSIAVAQRLHESGIPFVVATGYGETAEIVAAYPPCVVIQKPFSEASLKAALFRVVHNTN